MLLLQDPRAGMSVFPFSDPLLALPPLGGALICKVALAPVPAIARPPARIAKSQAADLRLDVYNTPLLALVMDGSHVGIDMALVTFTYLYY